MPRPSGLASQVNWLFLREEDIRTARQVIAAAGPESTVDVLGLGGPVEKISDLLFPGTSTLHTQLRYVIFVPAILYAMQEMGGVPDPFGFLKRKETELIDSLLRGGIKAGVIGRTRGEALKYWPSMTYWSAIQAYGALGEASSDRAWVLESLSSTNPDTLVSDDGDATDLQKPAFGGDARFRSVGLNLFADPGKARWPDKLTFDLRPAETRLLRDQIHEHHPGSLYVDMLRFPATRILRTASIFEIKPKRPELAALIREAGLYSLFSMGATLVYRWALCDHLVMVRKGATSKAEWQAYRENNRDQFIQWAKQIKELRTWQVKDLSHATAKAFPSRAHAGGVVESRLETFCYEMNKVFQGAGSIDARLQSASILAK